MNTNDKCACSDLGWIFLHCRFSELLQSTAWPL